MAGDADQRIQRIIHENPGLPLAAYGQLARMAELEAEIEYQIAALRFEREKQRQAIVKAYQKALRKGNRRSRRQS